jgi:SNF2 family DNA or RNA helicase
MIVECIDVIFRIYRIGQTRPTFIYRFVCKNTIEEKILKLQQKRKELEQQATTKKLNEADIFRHEDLLELMDPDDSDDDADKMET